MKNKNHALPFSLLLAALLIAPQFSLAVHIAGQVTDKNSGTGLDNVKVFVTTPTSYDSLLTDQNGNWEFELTSKVNPPIELPQHFAVSQNYPNPFNPSTNIEFYLPQADRVTIRVINIRGQVVAEKTAPLAAGGYTITFYGGGSAGLYFYTFNTSQEQVTRRMVQLDGSDQLGFGPIQAISSSTTARLAKKTSVQTTLLFRKLGYADDTLRTVIAQDTYFTTRLEPLHSFAIVADLHNDILEVMLGEPSYHLNIQHTKHHTDLPRLKTGGVDLQVFAVWASPTTYPSNPFTKAQEMLARLEAEIALAPDQIGKAGNLTEAQTLWQASKIAAIVGVEGGHHIENSLEKLHWLYDHGMRILTITWNNSTDWAVSAQDEAKGKPGGLTDFGRQVIRQLDSLGVIIDISHVGPKTIQDILAVTKNPIIASHSGVRALHDHYRNLTDDQIRAIAASGGVIGVIFYPYFLKGNSATINDVLAHIDYIVNLVGVDYVALGSDFDGIEVTVVGLENTSKFPALTAALLQHGYTNDQVQKILGGNFLRVWQKVCATPNL